MFLAVCTINRWPHELDETVKLSIEGMEAAGNKVLGIFVTGCEPRHAFSVKETLAKYGLPVWTLPQVPFTDESTKDLALEAFRKNAPTDEVLAALDVDVTAPITPYAFQFGLLGKAKSNKKTIVLPEGNEDRIIKAADYLLERDIVDLIIVGDENAILARGQELGLKSEYAALVDLFDGKTYRLERLLQRLKDEVRNTHEKGWLENRQAKKLEKEVLELDEKAGMVLMLQKGTFIRPLPEDGSVTPLSPLRIRAEIFYHAVPFTKILFMANLSLGLLALGWWIYSCVMQEGDKARNWRSRWRWIWVWAVWMACLFHWTSYLLRWYIGGRIPLGNGHETMLFLAGFLLLCTCIWQRRFSFLLPAGLLLSGFTLLVAYLSEMNPQITPLMPVLLSPWLSLHVSLIMVSYALFALMCLCSILHWVFGGIRGSGNG